MDWNGNMRPFVARPENSFSFLYNYNYDQFQGMEVKHPAMGEAQHMVGIQATMDKNNSYGNQDKKKRLTAEQLDSLESSFQEEIKLDPDRKMKLARELSLQPRQIAVWFQNRRARWKNKQLECLYDTLKQEFEAVSREKLKLQEEVIKLKAMLREQVVLGKQVSTGYNTEASAGEETVESTSVAAIRSSNKQRPAGGGGGGGTIIHHQIGDCNNYLFNAVEDYNPVSSTYWTALPSTTYNP